MHQTTKTRKYTQVQLPLPRLLPSVSPAASSFTLHGFSPMPFLTIKQTLFKLAVVTLS